MYQNRSTPPYATDGVSLAWPYPGGTISIASEFVVGPLGDPVNPVALGRTTPLRATGRAGEWAINRVDRPGGDGPDAGAGLARGRVPGETQLGLPAGDDAIAVNPSTADPCPATRPD